MAFTAEAPSNVQPRRRIGRYAIFGEIASGGMATVYFGRLIGAVGFSRSVAIKQLHAQYARSPEFVAQFLDEARLTARIRHPNVVQVLDVVAREGELFVIMEYVEGEPLSRLMRASGGNVPVAIACAVIVQALLGLHAAHDAKSDSGMPLEIVHRDVSPQNILVGVDGTSHILDFGVAKASSRVHTTENGQIKGKIAYMAPEQLRNHEVDRRVDIFAMGVVLWELLCGKRLFSRGDPGATVAAVLSGEVPAPRSIRPDLSPALEAVVLKALASTPEQRFATARDMAIELEQAIEPASALKTAAWVEGVAKESIAERAALLRAAEEESSINKVTDLESLQRSLAGSSPSAHPPTDATTAAAVSSGTATGMPLARKRMLISGALLMLLLGGFLLSRIGQKPEAAAETSAQQPPQAVAKPETQPPQAPVPAAPPADTLTPVEPTASSAATPSVTAGSAAKSKAKAVTGPARPAAKSTSTKAANCTPPFTLDAQGHKHFKPECF